jgi:hypothetical protein
VDTVFLVGGRIAIDCKNPENLQLIANGHLTKQQLGVFCGDMGVSRYRSGRSRGEALSLQGWRREAERRRHLTR